MLRPNDSVVQGQGRKQEEGRKKDREERKSKWFQEGMNKRKSYTKNHSINTHCNIFNLQLHDSIILYDAEGSNVSRV